MSTIKCSEYLILQFFTKADSINMIPIRCDAQLGGLFNVTLDVEKVALDLKLKIDLSGYIKNKANPQISVPDKLDKPALGAMVKSQLVSMGAEYLNNYIGTINATSNIDISLFNFKFDIKTIATKKKGVSIEEGSPSIMGDSVLNELPVEKLSQILPDDDSQEENKPSTINLPVIIGIVVGVLFLVGSASYFIWRKFSKAITSQKEVADHQGPADESSIVDPITAVTPSSLIVAVEQVATTF